MIELGDAFDSAAYVFDARCERTKSGRHIVEVVGSLVDSIKPPWCRQCGMEARRIRPDGAD